MLTTLALAVAIDDATDYLWEQHEEARVSECIAVHGSEYSEDLLACLDEAIASLFGPQE